MQGDTRCVQGRHKDSIHIRNKFIITLYKCPSWLSYDCDKHQDQKVSWEGGVCFRLQSITEGSQDRNLKMEIESGI